MTAPNVAQLGASTLVRKWVFEPNLGTASVPNFQQLAGVKQAQFDPDQPHWEDDSTMDSQGAGSQTKTAGQAVATLTVARKVLLSTGVDYDPVQEFLRTKAQNKYGPQNSIQMRICEYTPGGGPRIEAYLGQFGVGWNNSGGANVALDDVQITFQGQGQLLPITHPYPATAAVPTILTATPNTLAVAGGSLLEITGTGFTSTVAGTGVKIAGANAANWIVVSDNLIVATAPAHASGTGLPIVVTNAAGSSTGGPTVAYA